VSCDDDWVYNYFNYFTEIEEQFQRVRGTSLFRLSPLDWALVEAWKDAGVPLEAVLRGIDAAFEKWRGRRSKIQRVNSLAFCAQAVLTEAQRMAGTAAPARHRESAPPFSLDDLRDYLARNAAAVHQAGAPYDEIASALERLAVQAEAQYQDLEELERRLTVLEEKMIAAARSRQAEEQLLETRRQLEAQLRPYRAKMSAEHLALLEKQYLERNLLETWNLPRLSLFYLH
jgi:phage terminase Nu1 subunit (DNA packaging protein)